jgi:hypothetical protein
MSMRVRLSLIYAFLYMVREALHFHLNLTAWQGGGFVGIFMPILFKKMGLSMLQIGIIAAASPVAAMVRN